MLPRFCDYHKCRGLYEPYFISFGWISHSFSICGLPHISFNFPVELSRLIFCDCHKPPCFLLFYTLLSCCVDCNTKFCLFFLMELFNFSLCEYHKNILCVSIIFVSMWVFIFLCECHTNILESPLFLSGHSTLFLFGP